MLCHVLEKNGDCWLASIIYILYVHSYVFLFVMSIMRRVLSVFQNVVKFSSYGIQVTASFNTTCILVGTLNISILLHLAFYNICKADQFLLSIYVRYVDALTVCKSLRIFN